MFSQKYTIVEQIGTNTAIVKDSTSRYLIAKKRVDLSPKETATLQLLSHPNLLALIEVIREENAVYFIEEYCEEGDLRYHLRRHAQMKSHVAEELVGRWMLQILLALEYLHHRGFVHSSVSSDNIFLTSNGNIKLGRAQQSEKKSLKKGSETQTNNDDPKIDILGFGNVLYEVCWLKASLHLIKPPKGKAEELPSHYSRQLQSTYQQCIRREPTERPSAQQLLKTPYFLEIIEQFIKDRGISVNLQNHFPIKKYRVHRSKEMKKDNGKISRQKMGMEKKENFLPKIELQNHKLEKFLAERGKEKEKENVRDVVNKEKEVKEKEGGKETIKNKEMSKEKKETVTPKIRKKILSKGRANALSLNKVAKTEAVRKMSSRTEETDSSFNDEHSIFSVKQRKMPPLLPPPPSLTERRKIVLNFERRAVTNFQNEQQEIDMEQSRQWPELANFKKKELPQISEKLGKIFSNLKICEQDEELCKSDELRLTDKEGQQSELLVNTCKSKLEQLAEEINAKYSPDMQPIAERVGELDSSCLSRLSKLLPCHYN